MASYELGKWKSSTLTTLNYIKEQNDAGKHPRAKDIHNGTITNWIYSLKKGNYIVDNEGFILTEKGKELLHYLKQNPPLRTRTRKVAAQPSTIQKTNDNNAQISIQSKKIAFDTILPEDKAMKVISFIMDMIKKS